MVTWLFIVIMTHSWPWCVDHSIMINVTWRHFDQSAKQLIVGHTTQQYDVGNIAVVRLLGETNGICIIRMINCLLTANCEYNTYKSTDYKSGMLSSPGSSPGVAAPIAIVIERRYAHLAAAFIAGEVQCERVINWLPHMKSSGSCFVDHMWSPFSLSSLLYYPQDTSVCL